ncbi:TPA: hypothetical protein N0F65_004836 [Lagenidium giganteum]|uniref:Pyoverdine biosynthesis n=1 Tax=Lagenidium giganteum TaxID=4803 RepID=A0AAV2Z4B3_9STRA|nr:TPA: hypothetical protein N0F65_004836 [Lagenidium giganteum]
MAPNNERKSKAPAVPELVSEAVPVARCNDASMVIWARFLAEFQRIQCRLPRPLDRFNDFGKALLQQRVLSLIDRQQPITLVLPALPCKSPNRIDKVLGAMPDRAEELALERLEHFCAAIAGAYAPGCDVVIFSDGLVFNDLLGVSRDEVMAYQAELQSMARYKHIRFDGLDQHTSDDPASGNVNDQLLKRFKLAAVDMDKLIASDEGHLRTYRSFIKFLQRDLAPQRNKNSSKDAPVSKRSISKQCGVIAKTMIQRNMAFSLLVDAVYPNAVRVSIHAYNNAGPKFGVHLIPSKAESKPKTPWHCCICEDRDGTIHKTELSDVDHQRYVMSYKRGRAWGFTERQPVSSL